MSAKDIVMGIFSGGAHNAIQSVKKSVDPKFPKVPERGDASSVRSDLLRTELRRRGARSTILTSPTGVTGDASISRKTLLGE